MSPDSRAVLGRAIADYRRLVAAVSEHPTPADLAEVLYRMSLAARSLAAGALGLAPLLGTPELWLLDAQIAAYGRHPSQGHAAEMLGRRIETAGGAVATLAKHLGILGTYPPRCYAVLPVGMLTPAMLAYPDEATAADATERDRRKAAPLDLPAYLPDEREHLDADALRPADCFRCAGVGDACPLVADPSQLAGLPPRPHLTVGGVPYPRVLL